MNRLALGSVLVFLLCAVGAAMAADLPMTASQAFPAAMGKVSFHHDRNKNTSFTVHTKHLARPDALTPAKSVYVVWVQPRGQDPQNAGTLSVNENLEGSLSGTTPAQVFDVYVTAEDSGNVQHPSGPEVLRTTVQHQ